MGIKEIVVGGAVTLVIGGTAYTVNKTDVIDNFANDTGVTQQQAENYVNNLNESDLVSYDQLGADLIADGESIIQTVTDIDCVNYKYDWETPSLSCDVGKTQLSEIGNDEIALGQSYKKLGSDSAGKTDMSNTIGLIDEVNADYGFEIVSKLLDSAVVKESSNANSYNKATLQAALKSE